MYKDGFFAIEYFLVAPLHCKYVSSEYGRSVSNPDYRNGGMEMDSDQTIDEMKRAVIAFRDERNWKQYHDPKNLSIGLSIEAAELQELFLWKSKEEVESMLSTKEGFLRMQQEIADIFIFLLYLSSECKIDLSAAVQEKIKLNREKYPVEKSYNSNRKYTELE